MWAGSSQPTEAKESHDQQMFKREEHSDNLGSGSEGNIYVVIKWSVFNLISYISTGYV